MRALACIMVLATTIAFNLAAMGPAAAESKKISDFFGVYSGQSISATGEGLSARDLSVTIKRTGDGFNVSWTTVTHRADKSASRKSYSIDFAKSARKNVWGSAVRKDAFGNMRPVNPLNEGEVFVWATLRKSTLTIYALLIADDGGYELQTYARMLTAKGMNLRFTRLRDGEKQRAITGVLIKK